MDKARLLKCLAALAGAGQFACTCAHAEEGRLFRIPESEPISEVWLSPGFYSYHFQRNKDLNDRNPGVGVEYRFLTTTAVAAGRYYNSNRMYSNYLAISYQPFLIGPIRIGAAVGVFNGYPYREGGWFPAVLPVASFDYKRIGVNLLLIPNYKSVHGLLAFQLKLKAFD